MSNIPASVIIPKKITENMKRQAVGEVPFTPFEIKSPTSLIVKVPVTHRIAAAADETLINAIAGVVTFLSKRTITIIIVRNPNTANIVSPIIRTPLFHLIWLL